MEIKNISATAKDGLYHAIIEIPIGSSAKYEFRSELGLIEVDRFNYTAFSFPFNYGFIPGTMSQDNDPIDIVVISSQPILQGCLVQVRLLGTLLTEDEEGIDPKIIALPKAKVDPFYKEIQSLDDLPAGVKDRIKHFYENYKSLEPGKWVKIQGWQSREEAEKIVGEGIARAKK